jgi:acetolactate synthase-1/2/3 large subunit
MTSVESFIQGLQQKGVNWMATLCGHGLDPLFHAAKRAGMRLVDTRNEQTAGYIAESYGRLTRQPGVCCTSSGIALVNALTGAANAYFDGAPMMVISGAAAQSTAGLGHFQDFDAVAAAAPVTKYSRLIDRPERSMQMLDDAWGAAVAARPGPVHLMYPMDVQTAEVEKQVYAGRYSPGLTATGDMERLGAALAKAERPLLVAGSGVYYAGTGAAMLEFSRRYAIPVVVPIWDRGVVDTPSETFMGVIGAASGGPSLLADADCIVLAGADIDYRLGYLEPPAIAEGAGVFEAVRGWEDLGAGLKPFTGWLAEARRRRSDWAAGIAATGAEQAKAGTHAIHVIAAIKNVLGADGCLLVDGGSIGQWMHQSLDDRYPGHWLTCGRSGVVGWGLGGAMGARLAYPDRPVVLLSGDGAFTFTVAELECAARQKLPFVAVVADDQKWGITNTGHQRQFGEAISSSLGPIAFDKLAESLGARGVRVTDPARIQPELEKAVASGEVTVLHVPIVGGNPS